MGIKSYGHKYGPWFRFVIQYKVWYIIMYNRVKWKNNRLQWENNRVQWEKAS